MITVNIVKDGVISTLKQRFPNTKIYGEEIKQGFRAPCFFVKLFPVSQRQVVGRRYKRFHSFDIHYFGESNEEMHDIADQLYDRMEYIPVNEDLLRGTKMNHEIVDGVLHFFVNYDFHIYKVTPAEEPMGDLTVNTGLNKG